MNTFSRLSLFAIVCLLGLLVMPVVKTADAQDDVTYELSVSGLTGANYPAGSTPTITYTLVNSEGEPQIGVEISLTPVQVRILSTTPQNGRTNRDGELKVRIRILSDVGALIEAVPQPRSHYAIGIMTSLNRYSGEPPFTVAEEDASVGLPEGAKARLGKGRISGEITYSPDGTRLAVASSIGIWIYDARTWEALDLLPRHWGDALSMSYSPDGRTLASGSDDNTVILWDVNTGEERRTLTGHTDWVRSVSFSPDGRTLASGGWDGTIRLWDVNTGRHLRTLTGHTSVVWSVSYSPDGRTLASGSDDETIRLWDVNTGEHRRTLTGHTDSVSSVSFSPDGRTLTSGGWDGTIRLWDVATGWQRYAIIAHRRADVNTVSYSPDGRTLASGGWDGTIRLWDVNTGRHLRTLTGHTDSVSSVSYSPDGRTLASGSWDGTLRLWESIPRTDERVAEHPTWDVNEDGKTDIHDLLLVVEAFGTTNPNNPRIDVNGDGTVDKHDLMIVVIHLGESTDPAASMSVALPEGSTPETFHRALALLRAHTDGSLAFQRAIAHLEQLLATLIPEETALLANYPNPFNPETWIPYQLAKPADVTVHIYSINGGLVRTLALGHQAAGMYRGRSRAAYWDGTNAVGEPVASGVYFYTLTAGDFTATRKLLIRK